MLSRLSCSGRPWEDSGKVYGYRKLHDDLLDQGETCCPNRVARLASLAGIKARIGYKRRPCSYGGKPSRVVDNTLARQFDVAAPDKAWVTDITYIRTQEGFASLAVVIDLYSRRVVGWSIQNRQTTDLVLQALLMAVWRRKPKNTVLIRSDQGSQFTSMDWASFLKAHNLEHSMSRRGNCHDNAVVESLLAFGPLRVQPAQARAYTAADLSLTRRGQAGCVRLHRDVLQPDTQACEERDPVARRVRTAADDEHRGRLENSGLFTTKLSWVSL